MIPIPSYQLLEFFNWMSEKHPQINVQETNQRVLYELALVYIRSGMVSSETYILKLFQACPMISESTVLEQMEHFAHCGQCLQYIERNQVDVQGVKLHPLLQGFEEFSRSFELPLNISNDREFEPEERFERQLRHYIRRHGSRLVELFVRYLEQASPEMVRDYEIDGRYRSARRDDRLLRETHQSDDGGTEPIDLNPQLLHREAARLAASVELLVRGGFYEGYLEKQPAVLHHLAALGLMTDNTAQAIEFLGWLQERYPKIDILANAPVSEIKELALEFCETHNYENPLAFSKEVVSWLDRRSGSRNIIERLIKIGRQIKTRNQTYNSGVSPFKRYQTIRFHAIFLFLSAGDFPSFIKQYWQDLNFLTGDYLDIYYSYEDLNRRVSGFEVLDEFRSLRLEPMSLPALVLWQNSLKDAFAVSLEQLPHQEIFRLLQAIVQNIKNKQGFSQICKTAQDFVQSKTSSPGATPVIYYYVADQIQAITAGGNVEAKAMTQGDTYNQSGNFGIGHMSGGEIKGEAKVAGSIYEAEQQNLAEAAAQIQALLEQLSKTYPADTTTGKMKLATEVIERIESNPTLMERILSALKAGGVSALEQALNHPAASFVIGALEDWQQTKVIKELPE